MNASTSASDTSTPSSAATAASSIALDHPLQDRVLCGALIPDGSRAVRQRVGELGDLLLQFGDGDPRVAHHRGRPDLLGVARGERGTGQDAEHGGQGAAAGRHGEPRFQATARDDANPSRTLVDPEPSAADELTGFELCLATTQWTARNQLDPPDRYGTTSAGRGADVPAIRSATMSAVTLAAPNAST